MTTLDQIKSLMKSGDIAGAEALCRQALEEEPGNSTLKFLREACLGRMRLEAGLSKGRSGPPPIPGNATPPVDESEDVDEETAQTVELPPREPEKPAGRHGRPTPKAGKGCLRALLAVVGGLVALVVVVIVVACISNRGNAGNDKLIYLWVAKERGSSFEIPGGVREVVVPQGNFAISLPKWIDDFAEVQTFATGSNRFYEVCSHWTFPSPSDESRVDICYVRTPSGSKKFGLEPGAPILAFDSKVAMDVEFGESIFKIILGDDIDVVDRGKPKAPDWAFAKKHGADGFHSCFGTVLLGGKRYRMFQVTLTRGREAWRIQTTLLSALEVGNPLADAIDQTVAGEIIGRFRIIDGKRGLN